MAQKPMPLNHHPYEGGQATVRHHQAISEARAISVVAKQGLLENGQDTDRQNFYFLYLTENENLALISFEDL